jgi:hypothetical protein
MGIGGEKSRVSASIEKVRTLSAYFSSRDLRRDFLPIKESPIWGTLPQKRRIRRFHWWAQQDSNLTTLPPDVEPVNDQPCVFGRHALPMRRAGFAVLPAAGKAPKMASFNKWTTAPGPAAVEKWAARDPNANIVYVPGLCRTKRGKSISVLDGDDANACGRMRETFGPTHGMVTTRRGKHFQSGR